MNLNSNENLKLNLESGLNNFNFLNPKTLKENLNNKNIKIPDKEPIGNNSDLNNPDSNNNNPEIIRYQEEDATPEDLKNLQEIANYTKKYAEFKFQRFAGMSDEEINEYAKKRTFTEFLNAPSTQNMLKKYPEDVKEFIIKKLQKDFSRKPEEETPENSETEKNN